ncbi:hypothetical protein [Aliiroseovarius crassostreae]|uniref:hypothetical protein n=1 Tax=Aliiroseovarius crassostreae TaxID=154981 RepID=UPI00220BBEFE|nr:hypothetical protein [Aliiroseovarius crassostreae]UWP88610.1 hypothetical protein K3J57_12015 [Aliiroseovarius crassostreae]
MECLLSLDVRVMQGVLTLAASIVASGTALFIAMKVYNRQKLQDQKIAHANDIRRICAELVEFVSSSISSPAEISHGESPQVAVARKLAQGSQLHSMLLLYAAPIPLVEASDKMVKLNSKYTKALFEYMAQPNQEMRDSVAIVLSELDESRKFFIAEAQRFVNVPHQVRS